MKTQKALKAQEALDNRLYVSGWELSRLLKDIRDGKDDVHIVLARRNGKAVGVGVLDDFDGMIACFVKKAYRRRGIGTQLVQKLKKKGGEEAAIGIHESALFWEKNGVYYGY